MQHHYPSFDLEDKVSPDGEGYVTSQRGTSRAQPMQVEEKQEGQVLKGPTLAEKLKEFVRRGNRMRMKTWKLKENEGI